MTTQTISTTATALTYNDLIRAGRYTLELADRSLSQALWARSRGRQRLAEIAADSVGYYGDLSLRLFAAALRTLPETEEQAK